MRVRLVSGQCPHENEQHNAGLCRQSRRQNRCAEFASAPGAAARAAVPAADHAVGGGLFERCDGLDPLAGTALVFSTDFCRGAGRRTYGRQFHRHAIAGPGLVVRAVTTGTAARSTAARAQRPRNTATRQIHPAEPHRSTDDTDRHRCRSGRWLAGVRHRRSRTTGRGRLGDRRCLVCGTRRILEFPWRRIFPDRLLAGSPQRASVQRHRPRRTDENRINRLAGHQRYSLQPRCSIILTSSRIDSSSCLLAISVASGVCTTMQSETPSVTSK